MITIDNTLFVGKFYISLPNCDSTNEYATEMIAKNRPPEGTVISTFRQTQGRGQIGTVWESEFDKNIALSIIFYPHWLSIEKQFYLSKAIAIGVHDFVNQFFIHKNIYIKWPNDVFIGNKKVAGILLQNSISKSSIASTVVGIGININQTFFSNRLPNATSFAIESNLTYNLNDLIGDLCYFVEKRFLQLKAGHFEIINQTYWQYLYQKEMTVSFQRCVDGSFFSGNISGISENGQILINTINGVESFSLKEVKFL